MRVYVGKHEVDVVFRICFTSTVEAYQLDVVACPLVVAPLGIAAEFQVDTLFNRRRRPASAGAKVNEGVGSEGGTEEGSEGGGEG